MRVLVTFAVDAEFAPWRKLRKFQHTRFNEPHYSGGAEVHRAGIGSCEVLVYLTGMGIMCFPFEAACCFKDGGVDAVISSGLAGALQSHCQPLDIITPLRVGTLRDARGQGTSKCLTEALNRSGAAQVDTLLTSDHLVETHGEKARLAIFGDAVDMESFHVVRGFADLEIPVAVARAISDGSDEDLPLDFEKCLTPSGRVRSIPLAKQLAKNPGKLPDLIRFGRQSRAAAAKLATFLDQFIVQLKPEPVTQVAVEKEAP
jgi:adenosylhomocysteine nucleosidase